MSAKKYVKYKPIFCKRVEEFLAKGYSQRASAGHLNVSNKTFWTWKDKHPEFKEACERGRAKCEKFYIGKALCLIDGEKGSFPALSFMLKNLFKGDWSENPVSENEDNKDFTINIFTGKPVKKEE